MTADDAVPPPPLLRVVRGEPTPAELAALVAVLSARGTGDAGDPRSEPVGGWAQRGAGLRRALPPGPGAWRRSGFEKGVRTRGGV